MIEAYLICSQACEVEDLGLSLRRGDEVWVSVLASQQSKDLHREIAKGNIRMSRRTRKPDLVPRHVPPFVALQRAPGPGVPHPASRVVKEKEADEVAPPPPTTLDVEEVARRVRADLIGDVKATVAEEMSRALSAMPTQAAVDPSQLASVLEGVLRRVMPVGTAVAAAPSSAKRSASSEEPLYLPTNIVDKDAKGKVVLESHSSEESEDLDEAAAALREIKRRRGKSEGAG